MGTRATIAIERRDGTVLQTYLHQDGYPINVHGEGAGATLLKYYKNAAKVERLVSMGAIYALAPNTGGKNLKRKDNAMTTWRTWFIDKGITRFAKRDMNDPKSNYYWDAPPTNKEYADRQEYLAEEGEAYDYLFTKEKEWLITKHRSFTLYPLDLYLATNFSKTELDNMCK